MLSMCYHVYPVFPKQSVHTEGFLQEELRLGFDQSTLCDPRLCCCKFSHKWLLYALVRCSCAFRQRRLAQSPHCEFCPMVGPSIFPVNSRIRLLLWDVHVHKVKVLGGACLKSRERLLGGSCIKILSDPLLQQVLLSWSCELLLRVLALRSWPRSCEKILWRS
jgi:hypothetical protein